MTTPFASASLYVGDLANDVTEANLFDIFNQVGAVASIRVCRDAITRRSLGYAYVNFHSAADAERALDQINNQPIKGRPCRIMWSQRDPALRRSGRGNIFIKNLDKSIDHKALADTFAQFGQIISCKIELDRNNESKGYGYIQFATQDSAEKAIQRVNNMLLVGKKVFVGPFVPRKGRIAQKNVKEFTNVYVKDLNTSVDEEQLQTIFGQFGQIKSAVIMKDEEGKSKGFAFINYDTAEGAGKCVDEMNGKDIDGKTVYVGRAQKKAEREAELKQKFEAMRQEQMMKFQGVNLYVKNLDDDVDDDKLRGIFDPFGTITSCRVMRDGKLNSKGFGFVCYTSPEEATKAVTEMNGKIIGSKPLYVALAQRKDVRRAQLEAQFASRPKIIAPGAPYGAMPANSAPMFYPPGAQPGFVYGGMVAPRGGRFTPGFAPPGNYVMVGGRGGQMKGGRGGMNVVRGRGGMKPQHVPQMQAPTPEAQTPSLPVKLTPQILATFPPEEQKSVLGERIYPLILKSQPALAGKITGMILDSLTSEEILALIENTESLGDKVTEALKVLQEHETN